MQQHLQTASSRPLVLTPKTLQKSGPCQSALPGLQLFSINCERGAGSCRERIRQPPPSGQRRRRGGVCHTNKQAFAFLRWLELPEHISQHVDLHTLRENQGCSLLARWACRHFWGLFPAKPLTKICAKPPLLRQHASCFESLLPRSRRQDGRNCRTHSLQPLLRCHKAICRGSFLPPPLLPERGLKLREQVSVARLQVSCHVAWQEAKANSTSLGMSHNRSIKVTSSHIKQQDDILLSYRIPKRFRKYRQIPPHGRMAIPRRLLPPDMHIGREFPCQETAR